MNPVFLCSSTVPRRKMIEIIILQLNGDVRMGTEHKFQERGATNCFTFYSNSWDFTPVTSETSLWALNPTWHWIHWSSKSELSIFVTKHLARKRVGTSTGGHWNSSLKKGPTIKRLRRIKDQASTCMYGLWTCSRSWIDDSFELWTTGGHRTSEWASCLCFFA